MPQNSSYKHHFVPKFYLENFTNSEGKFYIYLVKEKRFKKDGALFTPKSHFFQEHANTVDFGIGDPDHLEVKYYSKIDNDLSAIVDKIKNSSNFSADMTAMDLVALDYFFCNLFWRNPINDQYLKDIVKNRTMSQLGISYNKNGGYDEQIEQLFRSHPDFYKIIRSSLAGSLYHQAPKSENTFHIMNLPAFGRPALLSDNPVILRKKEMSYTYLEEMIVPITSDLFYLRSKTPNIMSDYNIKTLIDIAMLKQANEYVCVTDKTYVEKLEDIYNETKTNENELRDLIFHGLQEFYKNKTINQPEKQI